MKQKTELLEELCADKAVCFIADRHHVTPQQLLYYFLFEKNLVEKMSIPLEPNEMEILKGLSEAIEDKNELNMKTRQQ